MNSFYKKNLFALLVLGLYAFPFGAAAQTAKDTVVLEGFINADKTLTPDKIYRVRHNVKVDKSATLNVNPGTTVVFDPDAVIVLEGGLNLNGAPNNFIEFLSTDPTAPGNGVHIRGSEGGDIKIRYTVFKGLKVPLHFQEWLRKNVSVEKNVFTELYSGESAIVISSPLVDYKPGGENLSNFSFSYNSFYNNWGSIFIENFEDNFLKLKFNNNLVSSNVVYGVDIGTPSNTPVFGLFDDTKEDYKMEMKGNSIFGNYQINASTDTILREISVGIQGDGQEFSIPNNFFRAKSPNYIYSTFDHFYQNTSLPLLKGEPFLPEPEEETPPHIYKVKINGNEIQNYDYLPQPTEIRDVSVDVYFNKPVSAFGEHQLEAVSFDSIAQGVVKTPVAISNPRWSADKKVLSFTISNGSFLRDTYTFVIFKNFVDREGFLVPNFQIGQRRAINIYRRSGLPDALKTRDINQGQLGGPGVTPESAGVSKATADKIRRWGKYGTTMGPYRSLSKTWEAGLMLGTTNYFGSLTYKLVDREDFNFAIGGFGQYNFNKWISLRAMLWYGRLTGSDSDEEDPDRHMRHFNFRNDVIEGSLTFHWHLLKYGTSKGEKFTPTIFAGISIFRNKPMARILLYERAGDPEADDEVYLTYKNGQFIYDGSGEDVWVSLREIGTEGQTQDFGTDPEADPLRNSPYASLFTDHKAPKQYKKVQVAFPIGFSLDYILYNRWVVSLELGVRVSTTRYLDDIGGYYWDRGSVYSGGYIQTDPNGIPVEAHQSIIDANPEIWARVNGEDVLLPNTLTFTDPNTSSTTTYSTAALLANPSLIDVDETGVPTNDAFTFNNAKRSNPKSKDHFAFIGLKVSKVIPGRAERLKYKKPKKNDAFMSAKDKDNDFLPDDEEKVKGTNPKVFDTDGDLLSDGEEVNTYKSDPLKKDTDGDGLDDGREVRETRTEPVLTDSDGDGLDDGKEVNVYRTNPTEPDTDGGGIGDGEEVNQFKTNPLDPNDDAVDSDGDGVLDRQDVCPKVKGIAQFKGCPDSDKDGIEDAQDRCPYEAGSPGNEGCPEELPAETPED